MGTTRGSVGDVSADPMAICAWAIVGSVSPTDRAFNDLAIKVTVEPANRARPLAARSKWETLPQLVRDRPAAEVLAEKARSRLWGRTCYLPNALRAWGGVTARSADAYDQPPSSESP